MKASEVITKIAEASKREILRYNNLFANTADNWGIVTCGEVTISNITANGLGGASIDVSGYGFTAVSDYDVFMVISAPIEGASYAGWEYCVLTHTKSTTQINLYAANNGSGDVTSLPVAYVIVAKGFGGFSGNVPAGGTKGQALVKKSGTDGDYEWGYEVPSYEMSDNDTGGNVVQVGNITVDGTTYGIYEFYYRTGALPAADATKEYSLATLLADYTVGSFIDATGVTTSGLFIGNGRTDGTNRIIVQQFSKNNKTVTLRAYQDFRSYNAILKIKFYGTKNV